MILALAEAEKNTKNVAVQNNKGHFYSCCCGLIRVV